MQLRNRRLITPFPPSLPPSQQRTVSFLNLDFQTDNGAGLDTNFLLPDARRPPRPSVRGPRSALLSPRPGMQMDQLSGSKENIVNSRIWSVFSLTLADN